MGPADGDPSELRRCCSRERDRWFLWLRKHHQEVEGGQRPASRNLTLKQLEGAGQGRTYRSLMRGRLLGHLQ